MIDGRRVFGTGLALLSGALLAVQARVNGELGERLGNGVLAALISFGTGLVLLLAAAALSRRMRAGVGRVVAAARAGRLRWWQLVGGSSGAYFVACQGLTISSIGVAVFTVAVVAGQAVSGLVVDRFGLGPAGPQAITGGRVLTAVGSVLAVLVTVSDRLSAPAVLVLAALPLLAGLGLSWQQAVNGRVGAAGGPMPATLLNFGVGAAVLTVAASVAVAVQGPPAELPAAFPADAWLYVGGTLGIPVVLLGVVAVRWTGVLLLGMATVAGQVVAALVLDLVAPAAGRAPSAVTVLGCVLALAVVAAAGLTRPAQRPS